jgi:uncharacterized protein (DUF1684 family)
LNEEYKDKTESPLDTKAFKKFKGHVFFAINLLYRVSAKLTVTPGSAFFPMKTTTSRLPNYRVYGLVEFMLAGKTYKVPVYQSEDLMKRAEYADHLFFPFTDLTSGKTSYGGGRFIDLNIPTGEEIVIDFNQSYNPYCAYNHRYSCPIVPEENYFDIEIPVGVMYKEK